MLVVPGSMLNTSAGPSGQFRRTHRQSADALWTITFENGRIWMPGVIGS
jgi:hypothetical protein